MSVRLSVRTSVLSVRLVCCPSACPYERSVCPSVPSVLPSVLSVFPSCLSVLPSVLSVCQFCLSVRLFCLSVRPPARLSVLHVCLSRPDAPHLTQSPRLVLSACLCIHLSPLPILIAACVPHLPVRAGGNHTFQSSARYIAWAALSFILGHSSTSLKRSVST